MHALRMVLRLLAVLLPVVLGAGCHGHRASSLQVTDPGVHVVSSAGGHSVIWSDGKVRRACTLGRPGMAQGKQPGKRVGGERAKSSVDAALFRLCEARGNGDLTQDQYVRAVEMVLAHMARESQSSHVRPWGHGPHSHRHPRPDAPRGGMKEGCPCQGCPRCLGLPNEPNAPAPPNEPMPQGQSL